MVGPRKAPGYAKVCPKGTCVKVVGGQIERGRKKSCLCVFLFFNPARNPVASTAQTCLPTTAIRMGWIYLHVARVADPVGRARCWHHAVRDLRSLAPTPVLEPDRLSRPAARLRRHVQVLEGAEEEQVR